MTNDNKKSFVMYTEYKAYKDTLDTVGKAELLDAILDYENDRNVVPTFTNKAAEAFFLVHKNNSDRNEEKWLEAKRRKSEGGKNHKGNQYKKLEDMEDTSNTSNQMEDTKKNGSNGTVNVNVNENVNVNANVNVKENSTSNEVHTPKATRFVKPSLSEIEDYCFSRNNHISAQIFYDFYESKGWKVGNSPMKDWKAAVRTWEIRSNSPRGHPGGMAVKDDIKPNQIIM